MDKEWKRTLNDLYLKVLTTNTTSITKKYNNIGMNHILKVDNIEKYKIDNIQEMIKLVKQFNQMLKPIWENL